MRLRKLAEGVECIDKRQRTDGVTTLRGYAKGVAVEIELITQFEQK